MLTRALEDWKTYLISDAGERELAYLYSGDTKNQQTRYLNALAAFKTHFSDKSVTLISAPGRTELAGNHCDHQHGCVLAAAVTLDILAVAAPNGSDTITLFSEGYGLSGARIDDTQLLLNEYGTTAALIKGVVSGVKDAGFCVRGFDAYITSGVPQGSGLSSSAALEVLLSSILSELYNDGRIPPMKRAQIGQYAENVYFGKPCGLMDQAASALGSAYLIDFKSPDEPVTQAAPCGFAKNGYSLFIVNAGGSHANLTPEYAAIPEEMRSIAAQFGCDVLREVDESDFFTHMGVLRGNVSDRSLLRALHFFAENSRVPPMAQALRNGDMRTYIKLMRESGESSSELLQNIYPVCDVNERSVSLALALAGKCLGGEGAYRIHGGGFAGTIQALVPQARVSDFRATLGPVFGEENCYEISIRPVGGWALGK